MWLWHVETMTVNKHTLKHHQVEAVPLEREPGLRELCDRFSALRGRGLDPFELEVLSVEGLIEAWKLLLYLLPDKKDTLHLVVSILSEIDRLFNENEIEF